MSSVAELDHVRELLECVAIDRVISVDDRHSPDLAVVLNTARELSSAKRSELLGLSEDDEALAEHDVFEQRLEPLWDQYGAAERTALVQRAQEIAGDSLVADDTEALSRLGQLMSSPEVFEELSKADWRARRDEIVESGESVLVLFDRDFRGEGGQERDGETLLAELQKTSRDKPIWTGLLTHTVTPEAEHEEYLKLGDTVDLHQTVMISKARVAAGEFAAHLRLTLLTPLLQRLLTIVSEKTAVTHKEAMAETRAILPVELESMVFGASRVEGVWEPDTLLLLVGLIQRDRARAKIWEDDEVHRLTDQIRCLGRVDAGPPVADEQAEAESEASEPGTAPRFYQRRQIYEDAVAVNKLHLPIENGDVFEDVARSSKRWIAIAQPCDLVVRSNGLRGGYPSTHVAVAPIEREPRSAPPPSDFRLPYFDDQGRHYVAKLGQVRYQRLWLLDLAVFNSVGRALLCLNDDAPTHMLEGWAARHAQVRGLAETLINLCETNTAGLEHALGLETPPDASELRTTASAVRDAIAADHSQPPFTTTIRPEAAELDAGCQRVKRLSTEYAQALLARWGGHLSRPVLPYDLTRRPDV